MSHILITGGTGFIGAYVAKSLMDAGHSVVCFDNVAEGSRPSLLGDKAVIHRGDVTRIEELLSAMKQYNVDRIISLAFLMATEAERNLQLAVQVNILGVNNVFEAARLWGIKRVVCASSITCYGDVSWYGDRLAREIEEDFHLAPHVYGAAKQFNEFMAGRYNQYQNMEIVCLRPSVVFGYGRQRGPSMWIDNMISNPLRGRPAHVPRKSGQMVNLIYVKDLADMFAAAVTAPELRHRIYNAGRHTVSIKELSQVIKKFIPDAEFTFDEEAPAWYLVHAVDDSRLREEFYITRSLEENILDQIQEVREAEALQI